MRLRCESISRIVVWLAGLLALIMAAVPPLAWFGLSYGLLLSDLKREAEVGSRLVTALVAKNALLWQFDEVRLNHVLESLETDRVPAHRSILGPQGVVAESRIGEVDPPAVSEASPVWDAGKPVGYVEVRRSLRPLIREAAILAAVCASVSGGALLLFLLYPVSALRKALGSLSEEKERARTTLQSIADGVIATDADGKVLLMNGVAESVTGWPLAEAAGRPLEEVFPLRDANGAGVRPPVLPPGSRGFLDSPRSGKRLIDATEAAIAARGKGAVKSVVVFRDVTEKSRMEEEVLRGRKLESLGILAGGIAHDFNNLLTGVLGNVSLAKDMMPRGRRERMRLEEAEKAALKAKELANRLLAFSKGGNPDRRRIPAAEVVRDAARLAVGGTNVRCEFRAQDGLWEMFADPGQIEQVIGNLVINAVQAMPAGGTVRVEMENAPVREGEILHVKEGKYVKVEVTDEGGGIPAEILPRIFDPYFTTKEKGNGLGLANCYTIMKGHGGNIFADSPPGRGATFRLYVPSTGRAPQEAAPAAEPAALPGKGRVLLMDDEDTVRDVAGEMLERLGYAPRFARTGEEAIEMYAREAGGPGAFDLVILDLTVPGGMGGMEASRRLLEDFPDARIIVSSGRVNDPAMLSPGMHGLAGAAAKPYRLEELSRVLRSAQTPG
ncbi:MAG: ATP-binding protein [Thermodesulfobacteriota bacterium]